RGSEEHVVLDDETRIDGDVILNLDIVPDGRVTVDIDVLPDVAALTDPGAFRDVREMPDLGSRADFGAVVDTGRLVFEVRRFGFLDREATGFYGRAATQQRALTGIQRSQDPEAFRTIRQGSGPGFNT